MNNFFKTTILALSLSLVGQLQAKDHFETTDHFHKKHHIQHFNAIKHPNETKNSKLTSVLTSGRSIALNVGLLAIGAIILNKQIMILLDSRHFPKNSKELVHTIECQGPNMIVGSFLIVYGFKNIVKEVKPSVKRK